MTMDAVSRDQAAAMPRPERHWTGCADADGVRASFSQQPVEELPGLLVRRELSRESDALPPVSREARRLLSSRPSQVLQVWLQRVQPFSL
jgi:hypothetical protein